MPRGVIARLFLDELPLKVVSMVLAITLFVIVRSDKDAATGAYVKVVYTLPKDRVVVSDLVDEVRIGVRGPWTRLQRFDEHALEPIRVDLTNRQSGPLRFDEGQVKLPVGLRVASITPAEVNLSMEERLERELPVQPIFEGQPADGFRVARATAQPDHVRVDGARHVVEGMQRVSTRPFRIDGARSPMRGQIALEPAPRWAHVDVSEVEVTVDVQPAIVERTLDAVPIRVHGLAKMEATIDPPQARVILRGPGPLVTGVTIESLTLAVDGALADTKPPARYLRQVTVNGLPAGVAAEVEPDSVTLSTRRKRD